jgi:hypothetical protein
MTKDNDHLEPKKEHQLEEYKVCHEATSDLSDQIWRTAAIFTVGSITGILLLARDSTIPDDLAPWLLPVASVFAIGILFTWWRFARRWWSVQQVMFLRMRHIEYQLGLSASRYVEYLNQMKRCETLALQLPEQYKEDFEEELKNLSKRRTYEHRGIQPMMEFAIVVNAAAWVAFLLIQTIPHIECFASRISAGELVTIIRSVVVVGYTLGVLVYGRRQWNWDE